MLAVRYRDLANNVPYTDEHSLSSLVTKALRASIVGLTTQLEWHGTFGPFGGCKRLHTHARRNVHGGDRDVQCPDQIGTVLEGLPAFLADQDLDMPHHVLPRCKGTQTVGLAPSHTARSCSITCSLLSTRT